MRELKLSLLTFMLLATCGCYGRVVQSPPDPPPAGLGEMQAAKKVFISNTGGDGPSVDDFPDGISSFYNQFVADLQASGRYQIALAPADADLILSLAVRKRADEEDPFARTPSQQMLTTRSYPIVLHLVVLDRAKLEPLWATSSSFMLAYATDKKMEVRKTEAVQELVTSLVNLVGAAQGTAIAPLKQ